MVLEVSTVNPGRPAATGPRGWIEHHPVAAFVGLTFAVSWGAWIPVATGAVEAELLRVIGGFGPTIAALVLTGATGGVAGLAAVWRALTRWRAKARWYVFCLVGPPIGVLLALGGYRLVGGTLPPLELPTPFVVVVGFLYVLLTSVLGEEIGWRGYALPRLQRQHSALGASLVLGVVWFAWHLPLFATPSSIQAYLPLPAYAVQILAFSVVYTWLYNSTAGSLVFPHVLHTAANFSFFLIPILPMAPADPTGPLWAAVLLLVVVAVTIVTLTDVETLSRSGKRVTGVGRSAP